ncbi:hypothetical protein BE11_22080, partial [Sorangium cellulosum]
MLPGPSRSTADAARPHSFVGPCDPVGVWSVLAEIGGRSTPRALSGVTAVSGAGAAPAETTVDADDGAFCVAGVAGAAAG